MAIDSKYKKFSILDLGSPIQDGIPISPGSLEVFNKWQIIQEYVAVALIIIVSVLFSFKKRTITFVKANRSVEFSVL